MPTPTTITRKTVSFPVELADVIRANATEERRSFSAEVVKALEDIFCTQASDASPEEAR